MPTSIRYDDLADALMWASSGAPAENQAFLSRKTGKVFNRSADGDFEAELPDDIDDESLYVEIPHENQLDLGRDLIFRFIDKTAPALAHEVRALFRQRGAHAQFTKLLERHDLLDAWFEFERAAKRDALTAWARENGFAVIEAGGAA